MKRGAPPSLRPLSLGLLAALVASGCLSTGDEPDSPMRATTHEGAAPGEAVASDPLVAELILEYRSRAEIAEAGPRAHAELAMVYEANGLWRLAKESFGRAVELAPDEPLYRLHHATTTIRAGDVAEGHMALAALVQSLPDLAPAQQLYGYAALDQGDMDSARAAFERLIALVPDAPFGYVGAGEVALRSGDFARAVTLLEPVLARDAGLLSARHLLGLAYRGLGREDDARRELALGLNSSRLLMSDALTREGQQFAVNLADQIRRARALGAAGLWEQAVALLATAAEARPENYQVRSELATAYAKAGRGADAERTLRAAIAIAPDSFDLRMHLADLLLSMARGDEAVGVIDEAIAIDPAPPSAVVAKVRALHRLGRDSDAVGVLVGAGLEDDTLEPALSLDLAGLELALGRKGAARAHFRGATLGNIAIAGAGHVGLAHLALGDHDLDEARSRLALARAAVPHHPMLAPAEQRLKELSAESGRP